MDISSQLLQWYRSNRRDFPWRTTKNPYKIWLSEIILQQTRTSQGLDYYLKFTNTFPKIEHLASAKETRVLKLWQGLGYYSRARNLHATAQYVQDELQGIFPKSYEDLIKLKGIGPYTAAAISSICFKEVKAAVDGNVYRVLSRIFDIDTAINSTEGIKIFQKLADELICKKEPGDYNQALMDLGATTCKPKNPLCDVCPLQSKCLAKKLRIVEQRPVKTKKHKVKNRFLNYYCVEHHAQFYMKKRTENDIWKNLYDFPLSEADCAKEDFNQVDLKALKKIIGENTFTLEKARRYEHKLTHQKLHINVYHLKSKNEIKKGHFIKVNPREAMEFPVPKPIEKFFKELFNGLDFER